jgi:adenosylhomocysteinase
MTSQTIHKYIEKFHISNGKDIFLVNKGTAVNFLIKSVPDEIIDLDFAEIMLCTILLLKKPEKYRPGKILSTPSTYLNTIAKDWLKDINR